jgi:hypothetical protein
MLELGHVEGGGQLGAGCGQIWLWAVRVPCRVIVIVDTSGSGEWLRYLHSTSRQGPTGAFALAHCQSQGEQSNSGGSSTDSYASLASDGETLGSGCCGGTGS